MIDIIPANPDALDTWLIDSGGHIAISTAGLALLEPELSSPSIKPSATLDALRVLRQA
jgi:hypothetical protein